MSEQTPIAQARAGRFWRPWARSWRKASITLSPVFLDPPISALVSCHVGVGLLLAGLAWRRRRDADASIFLLLAIATAGTGPFGALGVLVATMSDTHRPPKASTGEAAAAESAGEISKRLTIPSWRGGNCPAALPAWRPSGAFSPSAPSRTSRRLWRSHPAVLSAARARPAPGAERSGRRDPGTGGDGRRPD